MIETETSIQVRYAETDAMGVSYHSNYLVWFDVARTRMMDTLGLPYRKLEENGYLLAVLEAQARYLRPSYFDDVLTVKTIVKEAPRVKLRIDYEVTKDGALLTTGHTRHAFINRQGVAIKPPEYFTDLLKQHF